MNFPIVRCRSVRWNEMWLIEKADAGNAHVRPGREVNLAKSRRFTGKAVQKMATGCKCRAKALGAKFWVRNLGDHFRARFRILDYNLVVSIQVLF